MGVVALVVKVVGEWEGVTYKYALRVRGGRSEVGGTEGKGEGGFPLYGKGRDPGGFIKGVSALSHNVRTLGRTRGVEVGMGHVLGMLKEALEGEEGEGGDRERLKTIEAIMR